MKKTTILLISLLIATGQILSACASNEAAVVLSGYTWKLVSYGSLANPTPAVPDVKTGMTFGKDGSLNGNVGCNSFGGDYKVKGDQITFGPIMATLMACPEPLMQQESTVFNVLTGTVNFKIDGELLTIYDASGANALRFVAESSQ